MGNTLSDTASVTAMPVTYHLGIIPDGNRRWAIERDLPVINGHEQGAKRLKAAVDWALHKPEIKELSVYILSEENFNRSGDELSWLNEVYKKGLEDLLQREFLHKAQCKVNMISTQPQKLDKDVV